MRILIGILVLLSLQGAAQGRIYGHGSYSLAAICKNGILLASDSRLSLQIRHDSLYYPFGYIDTVQKIFPLRNMTMIVMGRLIFDSTLFAKFVDDFSKNETAGTPILDDVTGFLAFIVQKYPQYAPLDSNQLIFAGYEDSIPVVYVYADRKLQSVSNGTVISDTKQYFRKAFRDTLTVEALIPAAENAVSEYKNRNARNKVVVGGPVMMIKINPDNTIQWLQNKPSTLPVFSTLELCNGFQNGSISVHFLPDGSKKQFISLFCNP